MTCKVVALRRPQKYSSCTEDTADILLIQCCYDKHRNMLALCGSPHCDSMLQNPKFLKCTAALEDSTQPSLGPFWTLGLLFCLAGLLYICISNSCNQKAEAIMRSW